MKKFIALITFVFLSIILISCDELNNDEVEVKFILDGKLIHSENVIKGNSFLFEYELENEDYVFLGWYDLTNDTKYTNKSKIFSNLTLHAKLRGNTYDIFYLNDTHGAVLKKGNELGLSYIANYINNTKDSNSIFITGGDTFQGQLISNENKGEILVEILNEMKLDAFVIGNHEFDWGLDEVLKYFNPNTDGVKANFPILGANVIDKRTNKRPEYIDSHTIVERNGSKIGIIGTIGDGLESSIATQRVEDYYFSNSYQAVKDTVKLIEDEVDFIIVATHGNDSMFNEQVAKLNKVSAIFNGHSHQRYDGLINSKIPYMQSGRYSEAVGHMVLEFDNNYSLINSETNNITRNPLLNEYDQNVEDIIQKYYDDLKHLYEDGIIKSEQYMNQNDLANYIAKIMAEVTNSVAGFQNSGGTRSTFEEGQMITAADIFQVFPFDNEVIYTKITGYNLKRMLNDSYFFSYRNINIYDIIDDELYTIATNDYIYYHNLNQDIFGNTEPTVYGDMYETFYEVMLKLKENGHNSFKYESPVY